MEESDKYILVLGNNYDGCLLTGDCTDVKEFRKIRNDIFTGKYKIKAGMKCCALYSDYTLYVWGRFIDKKVTHIPRVYMFDNDIRKVSCGDTHILILLDNSDVYVIGNGLHGELGLGDIESVEVQTKVSSNIRAVHAGVRTSFLIDMNDRLYVFGSNKFNELGLNENLNYIYSPVLNTHISNVICVKPGFKHTAFICKSSYYISGDNSKGVLGVEPELIKNNIAKLTKIDIDDIKSIKCGWNNTFILKKNGEMLSTGFGKMGQNGISNKTVLQFEKVELSSISKIKIGSDFSYAIGDNGDIYSWGWNEHYNLGNGNSDNVFVPNKLNITIGNSFKVF
jgi:alpha-tubulin suppressor-like RCC1 family protein